MESKFETVLPSVTRTAQSDSSITTGKIILSKYFSIFEIYIYISVSGVQREMC